LTGISILVPGSPEHITSRHLLIPLFLESSFGSVKRPLSRAGKTKTGKLGMGNGQGNPETGGLFLYGIFMHAAGVNEQSPWALSQDHRTASPPNNHN
jgi:hypothetical protein